MTTTNTTQTEETSSFNDAQLYWDGQDPSNAGWCLRWTDERGDENTTSIGEVEDAPIQALANLVAIGTPDGATGDITVFRGDRKAARITLRDGAIVDWRAL